MKASSPVPHTEPAPKRARNVLLWSIAFQLVVVLMLLVGCWFRQGVLAYSLLFGALTVSIPACWFALHTFFTWGMRAPPAKKVHRLYGAEMQKLLMTGVLSAAVFIKVQPLSAAGFFVMFMVLLLLDRAVPVWLLRRTERI